MTVASPRAQAIPVFQNVAACVLFAIGSTLVVPAAAQTFPSNETAVAVLNVSEVSGCLERSAVEGQVRERSSRIEFVPAGTSVPHLKVTLQRNAGRAVAVELNVAWPNGTRARRRLAATSCDEAASAIAFLIALTLDPASVAQGSTGGGGAGDGGATPENRAEGTASPSNPTLPGDATSNAAGEAMSAGNATQRAESAAAGDAARASGAHANEPAGEPTQAAGNMRASTPADDDAREAAPSVFAFDHVQFGLSAQIAAGIAPRAMPGLAVHATLALHGRGFWAPALQLEAAHDWVSGLVQTGGVADFQRTTVRLGACPIGLRASALEARACLTSALGSLTAQGSQSYAPRSAARLWVDLGASLLASVDLGSLFHVLAGVTLAVPTRRDRFAFRPNVFHHVGALSGEGQLGLGVRFP